MFERIPISYFFANRSSWALVSRNAGQLGTLAGRNPDRDGSRSHPSSLAERTAVRRRTLHVTDEELRYRIIRAEESLSELKSALEDMRSQRDGWQAMAQAKLLPANRAIPSW